MKRKNLFELMEKEIDFTDEYIKIEKIIFLEIFGELGTIRTAIEDRFRKWKYRQQYLSYDELRNVLNLKPLYYNEKIPSGDDKISMSDFFIYIELHFNLFQFLEKEMGFGPEYGDYKDLHNTVLQICENFKLILSKTNYALEEIDGKYIICEINPATTAVAEITDNRTAKKVIEYNHYALKGDLDKKQEILKILADKIEPKRKELNTINDSLETDLFFLFNSCNIRHNNDKQISMTNKEKEKVYDETYQLYLLATLEIDNIERKRYIETLKKRKNLDKG